MNILELAEIKGLLDLPRDLDKLLLSQKKAFMDFSAKLYDVPMPMQFIFPDFHSDCHIKGGYRQGSEHLVIKIANSSPLGGRGVILVFARATGELLYIMRDEGALTTLRTALAGMLVCDVLPWSIKNMGIVGSGSLAKRLHELLGYKYPTGAIKLYARNREKAKAITDTVCDSLEEMVATCDVIFTTTSSETPLIHDVDLSHNKALIALGSDDVHKSELGLNLYSKSDVVIVDSKEQALKFGDVAKARAARIVAETALMEFGEALKSGILRGAKTIIADFSGIGAQDVAIVEFVLSLVG